MQNKYRGSDQILLIRKTIHFNNTRMLMSAFFKGIFQQTFKVQKSVILMS